MLAELREKVLQANLALPKHHLVTFTWGNVSEIDRTLGLVAIKPSGVDYETMTADDIVIVDVNTGERVWGTKSPLPTQPPTLSYIANSRNRRHCAYSFSPRHPMGKRLNLIAAGTTHADYFYGSIPCTRQMTPQEIAGDYELETGKVIVETFLTRQIEAKDVPAVLVNSHGIWQERMPIMRCIMPWCWKKLLI